MERIIDIYFPAVILRLIRIAKNEIVMEVFRTLTLESKVLGRYYYCDVDDSWHDEKQYELCKSGNHKRTLRFHDVPELPELNKSAYWVQMTLKDWVKLDEENEPLS